MSEKRLNNIHFRQYWLVTVTVLCLLQYYWITRLSQSCIVSNIENLKKDSAINKLTTSEKLDKIIFLVCSIGTQEEDQLYAQAIRRLNIDSKVPTSAVIFPYETCLDSVSWWKLWRAYRLVKVHSYVLHSSEQENKTGFIYTNTNKIIPKEGVL